MADAVAEAEAIAEMTATCVFTRTRLLSRVITALFDEHLRPLGVTAPQLSSLVVIATIGPARRSEIGRITHQDRSTLTRNLQIMLEAGWIAEVTAPGGRRTRLVIVTPAGRALITAAFPAWREAQGKASALLGPEGSAVLTALGDDLMAQAAA